MTLTNIKYSPLKNTTSLTITSGFGSRSFYNPLTKQYVRDFHYGIDLVGDSTIVAPFKGRVISIRDNITGYNEKYSEGNFIIIDHGNGVNTAYFHIKYGTIKVKVGDIVIPGTELALVGATGYVTGPHLHFGIKINGTWVNPEEYLLGQKELCEEKPNTNDDIIRYIINYGDTLTSIAKKYNTTIRELVELNNIANPNLIIAGSTLKIPSIKKEEKRPQIHTVAPGENLSSIAKKYDTTWQNLYSLNKDLIDNPNYLLPGWKIKIE